MNKILTLLIIIFLVFSLTVVYAQETTETSEETQEQVTTPDSALYGLSNAYEKISLAFTFNKANKAEKELKFANKRLLAAQKLVKEKKLEHLQRLQIEHKELLEKAKANLDKIAEETPEKALENQIKVEKELENTENQLDKISTNLDLKIIGELNDEQMTKLKDFLNSLDSDVSSIKVKIKQDKDQAKLRIKNELNKSEEEVEKNLEEKYQLQEVKQKVAEKAVGRLEQKLSKLKEITQKHKDNGKDVSLMEQRLSEVESVLTEIKAKLQANDIENVKILVKKAEQMLNFREVFKVLDSEKLEKLKELEQQKIQKREEIKKDFEEIKEIKEKLEQAREQARTENKEEKQQSKTSE